MLQLVDAAAQVSRQFNSSWTGIMPLLVTRCLELQVLGYCSDITRTTAVGAAMSDDQRVVWNAVQHTLQASLLLHTAGAWPALRFN